MNCKSCEEARKAVKRKLKYIAGKLSWSKRKRSAIK